MLLQILDCLDCELAILLYKPALPDGVKLPYFRIAPERYDVSHTHDRTKLDVFAYAMTAYQLLLGEFPWPREMDSTIITKLICAEKRPEPYSDKAKEIYAEVDKRVWDLISDCWAQDPAKRPAFGEIVSRLKMIIAEKKEDRTIVELEMNVISKEEPKADSGVCQVSIHSAEPEPILLTSSSPSMEKEKEFAELKKMKSKSLEISTVVEFKSPPIEKQRDLRQDAKIKSKSVDYDFEFNTPILRSRLSRMEMSGSANQLPVPLVKKGMRPKSSFMNSQQNFGFETPMLSKRSSSVSLAKPSYSTAKTITNLKGTRTTHGVQTKLELAVTNFGQNTGFQGTICQDNGSPENITGFIRANQLIMTLTSRPMNFKGTANFDQKFVTGKWHSLGYSGEFEMTWR